MLNCPTGRRVSARQMLDGDAAAWIVLTEQAIYADDIERSRL